MCHLSVHFDDCDCLQDTKALREAVGTMCKKYSKYLLDQGEVTANIEDETETKKALEEVMRQKSFLERYALLEAQTQLLANPLSFRSVTSLKKQMEKERKNHKQEYFRKLRENAFLLEEIAELKRELQEAKKYSVPSQRKGLYRRTSSETSSEQ